MQSEIFSTFFIKFQNISENTGFFYEGYIALGCVIKGETYHFEIVSNETNRGLMEISLKHSFPLGNGIITAYNYDQALKRSLDKGKEAAIACYELIKIKIASKFKVQPCQSQKIKSVCLEQRSNQGVSKSLVQNLGN